jgi:hypothetical protein
MLGRVDLLRLMLFALEFYMCRLFGLVTQAPSIRLYVGMESPPQGATPRNGHLALEGALQSRFFRAS